MAIADDSTGESPQVDRDHVQSLERGIAVLLAFDEEHPEPTLAELAQITGFSRPAVRRFLITLERMGYVRGSGGRWSLTPRVLAIGRAPRTRRGQAGSATSTETAEPSM